MVPGWAVPSVGTAAAAVAPGAAAAAVKVKLPSIGWPSELATRHCTVYCPAGAPALSFCEATLSTISTGPSAQLEPAALLTTICDPRASGLWLNVTETFSGGAARVAPEAGLVDSAVSCADAGPPAPSRTAATTSGAQQDTPELSDQAHGQATPSVVFLTD